jgi:hypothetical protein
MWYASNNDWPDDIGLITTSNIREFLAYLRDTDHRFNSSCSRAHMMYDYSRFILTLELKSDMAATPLIDVIQKVVDFTCMTNVPGCVCIIHE